jgi:hypothetical protein
MSTFSAASSAGPKVPLNQRSFRGYGKALKLCQGREGHEFQRLRKNSAFGFALKGCGFSRTAKCHNFNAALAAEGLCFHP